eukprot:tig00020902_g14942.t1
MGDIVSNFAGREVFYRESSQGMYRPLANHLANSALMANAYNEMLCFLLPAPGPAQALSGLTLTLGSYFAGFLIPNNDIPRPWIWGYYLHFHHYTAEALIGNEALGLTFSGCPDPDAAAGLCVQTGDDLMRSYNFDYSNVGPNVGYILIYWAAFEAIKALAMHKIRHIKR